MDTLPARLVLRQNRSGPLRGGWQGVPMMTRFPSPRQHPMVVACTAAILLAGALLSCGGDEEPRRLEVSACDLVSDIPAEELLRAFREAPAAPEGEDAHSSGRRTRCRRAAPE